MQSLLAAIIGFSPVLQGLIAAVCVAGLWWGAELVIDGARSLARRLGISELIIGLTVVSVGSSFPEIFVNVQAGLSGLSPLGVGNVVGSCLVQISVILGICVLVGGPLTETRPSIRRDGGMVVGSIALLYLLGMDGHISVGEAIGMVSLYGAYILYLTRAPHEKAHHYVTPEQSVWEALAKFALGAVVVWVSSDTLIHIGLHAGEVLGISPSVIGIMSGIGTSVPELAVSLIALLRRSNGISIGNLLGSNITDPLFSLPMGALLAGGYSVDSLLLERAIPAWGAISLLVLLVFYFRGRVGRPVAVLLIALYIGSFWWFLQ
ncbi:sodium:calcium antiporter [Candidatus Peribacteria bacterium]|nr:sodium:calcium antiporter [Candidatus Peribacteria bacterium]